MLPALWSLMNGVVIIWRATSRMSPYAATTRLEVGSEALRENRYLEKKVGIGWARRLADLALQHFDRRGPSHRPRVHHPPASIKKGVSEKCSLKEVEELKIQESEE